jgi:type IV secretory pathway VirB2 component (pilin)
MDLTWTGGRRRGGTRREAGKETLNALVRAGFVARGVVYLVVGVLTLLVALGFGEPALDRGGALAAIASQPFGAVLLWLLVIGFAGLALGCALQAASSRREVKQRVLEAFKAVVYAVAAWTTGEFVTGGRGQGSSDSGAHDVTARMLHTSGGRVLLIAIALAVIVVGLVLMAHAATGRFAEDLRTGRMSRATRESVLRLGQVGNLARGLIVGAVGVFALIAALTDNPSRAKGLDSTLRSFAQTPVGPLALVLVSLGLLAFGLYCFAEARWRRTAGGVPR